VRSGAVRYGKVTTLKFNKAWRVWVRCGRVRCGVVRLDVIG